MTAMPPQGSAHAPAGTTDRIHTPAEWADAERSPEFVQLRRKRRRFVFPMAVLFLAWYLLYVLLADYAHDFMSTKIGGSNITIGLVFGLLQFVSTFAITMLYVRFADRELDPIAETIRERMGDHL